MTRSLSGGNGRPCNSRAALSSDLAVCLWIPLFALRCEERRRPELATTPTALLSPDDTRRVWQVSPFARRAGVRTGMTVSQAIGLCPSLTLCEPDPVYYDEQFSRLLLALGEASPVIEPAELGRVFVGVDGLEGLYGEPASQLEAIAQVVQRATCIATLGTPEAFNICGGGTAAAHERSDRAQTRPNRRSVTTSPGLLHPAHPLRKGEAGNGKRPRSLSSVVRLGWGRGKFLSWVAATRAKPGEAVVVPDEERGEFLANQPVAVLPVSPDTHRRLWQLGLKTLRQVARLPEVALVSQFGGEGRRAWQLATGNVTDPVTGRERPEPIVASLDFLTPVADRAMLAHALDKLIERALSHPRRTGWRVHVVRVRATLEHGASWMTGATLKDPSADRERIAAPLKVRLEHAPPAGAVEHLAVEFTAFARGTDELQLFARDASAAARAGRRRALHAAAHEIQTRLKRPMLYHIIEVQPWSRIPERRYALIDFEP
jgi:nucleotidyltransferase/DNA polymerase involved in DNA repair